MAAAAATTAGNDGAIVDEQEDTGLSVAAVVADMTAAGAFGRGAVLLSYEPDGGRHAGRDQFATVVHYGTATTADDGRGTCRRRLVIKLKHRSASVRELMNNDAQFHNEIHFYERTLPRLLAQAPADRAPSLCRYAYGRNECGRRAHRDAIVLENACGPPLHYRPAANRLDLDLEHAVVALDTLAKFHALSYRAKHADPATFAETIGHFRDTQWNAAGQWMIGDDQLGALLSFYVDRLAERGGGGGERIRRFRAEYLNDAGRALRTAAEPGDGPLTVLCHGDFNRNNMLFRYDGGGGGGPADALALDLATVRYGSPALDLSFFLYLNTDRRLRDAHWDRLMDAYCAALAAAVSDAPAVPVPGRERLDAEMRDHAFYGLAHVSFFTRIMMEEHKCLDLGTFAGSGLNNAFCELLTFGGDRATDRVTDVFQHFLEVVRYAQ